LASGSLNTPEEVFEQDDVCLNSDGSDCAMALLQRKAVVQKPANKAIKSTDGAINDHENEHHVILADPAYIALLQGVTTASGESLYDSVVDVSWPPSLLVGAQAAFWTAMYEFDFPNTALFTWGNKKSDKLLVFTPGTNSLCMQYHPTLHHMAKHLGFFVICPQLSGGPSSQESVMKGVLAVEWALANVGNFSIVTISGHSGGGSAVPAQAMQLLSKGIKVDGMVLQHAGVVFSMNVPGCASQATGANKVYCEEYFPADLLSKISSVPMLVITGSFCEWTKVQNSAWLSNYGCCYGCSSNPPLTDGICPSLTFPTPEFRPDQPPVTCETGCPDASFLLHPGDCMVETNAEVELLTYYADFSGTAVFVNSCGEHDYGTMLHTGLEQEGKPLIAPFLHSIIAKKKDVKELLLDDLLAHNGTSATCAAAYNIHDMCYFLETPYTAVPNPFYTAADGSTKLCKDAHINHATGPMFVAAKNLRW
jgi:hypothetical protein